jgi:flagellin
MTMRIKTNIESLSAQRFLTNNSSDLEHSMQKLSSGDRINRSRDDAAGLAISENLKAKIRGLGQAVRNANDGVSFIQVAESGLSEISSILIRLRELTVQASSDTVGVEERGYLDREYQQSLEEITRLSEQTEFNGQKLLAPDGTRNIAIQVGYNNTSDDVLNITLGDAAGDGGINAETLGLQGSTLHLEKREDIVGNLDIIDRSLAMVASSRATLGANEARLDSAINSTVVRNENMSAANSRIRDTDFAAETAELAKLKIMTQANISVLQTANLLPEAALQLLR